MVLCMLLGVLLGLPISTGFMLGENEDLQVVCAGRDFVLPVYSASRIVTFTPSSPPGPRRVILENNNVKDPRFEWTRDRRLLLKGVTHGDQGLYSIKLSSMFTYETVRLTVSECIKSVRQAYGETFHHSLPRDGSVLEFSPRGAPPEAEPVVLWNRTAPQEGAAAGRGRVLQDRQVWLAERVTQADQGNYTVRDEAGKILSRSTLTVQAHVFNVTRYPKESLHIPLFLHLSHAHLIFIPAAHPDDLPASTFDLGPPREPMQLVRDGLIVEQDPRYRSLVSLARNGSVNEVVVSRLSSRHQGTYVVRDQQGNLVSTTSLHVVEKRTRWRALLKSITVPSGMFVTLAGFILFIKRFPSCSLSQMIRAQQRPPPACPPAIHTQDYSVPGPQHPGSHCHPQPYKASSSWSPHPSPPGYTPVVTSDQMSPGPASVGGQGADRGSSEVTTSHPLHTKDLDHGERKTSFSVPGASDCLHSSEDCARFSIRTEVQTEGEKERWSRGNNFFSTLPLDTDTSDSCSIYTSDKLSFS